MIEKRKQWFQQFLENKNQLAQQDVLQFHRFGGEGDVENDINMKRADELRTVSITTLHRLPYNSVFNYYDLQIQQEYSVEVHHAKPVAADGQNQ
jgi:hypothetical protein